MNPYVQTYFLTCKELRALDVDGVILGVATFDPHSGEFTFHGCDAENVSAIEAVRSDVTDVFDLCDGVLSPRRPGDMDGGKKAEFAAPAPLMEMPMKPADPGPYRYEPKTELPPMKWRPATDEEVVTLPGEVDPDVRNAAAERMRKANPVDDGHACVRPYWAGASYVITDENLRAHREMCIQTIAELFLAEEGNGHELATLVFDWLHKPSALRGMSFRFGSGETFHRFRDDTYRTWTLTRTN